MTIKQTAAIGGGVIGGAWAARFVLNGLDCRIFDPHPEAERIVGEVMANAERAFAMLTDAPKPEKGQLTFVSSLEEAVAGADLIQESVPERLELKQKVHMQIDAAAPETALIGSTGGALVEAGESLDVRVRFPEEQRSELDRIADILILPSDARTTAVQGDLPGVPLSALADWKLVPSDSAISRRNGERVNTVQAFLKPGILPEEALQVAEPGIILRLLYQ